jgi:hypothetical protein
MRVRIERVALGLCLALPLGGAYAAQAAAPAHWDVIDRYCIDCHNTTDWAGSLSLEGMDSASMVGEAQIWEKVVRKMRTGMMPPPGKPRPERARLDAFSGEIETRLDAAAKIRPDPGGKSLHRLNRTEYRNAIRDLLAYDVDVGTMLPADDSAEGFDNIADVLAVSPTLIQAYVSAAMKVSRAVVGDPAMAPVLVKFGTPGGAAQREHIEGLPLGTRGGLRVTYNFPLDGEYEFRIGAGAAFRLSGPEGGVPPKLDVTIDDVQVQVQDPRRFRINVKAGPRTLGIALVEQSRSAGVDDLYARALARADNVDSVTIQGPFNATGPGDTPSRRAVFSCVPRDAAGDADCARHILARLAGRAFRQPLAEANPVVDGLLKFYEEGRTQGGFETGIQRGLARILVDPRFLYRVESDRPDLPEGAVYRISDLELASRLSFFLWSSIPDEALLATAAAGHLSEPRVLEREVRRMLADSRANALVENFAGQWLNLRELSNTQPLDREFDDTLRKSMEQETQRLFASVASGNRSVLELLDADYTFLDERLARHYGIEGVRGSYMRRVALPADSPRRGLLGQASILTVTSVGNRTSPVKRGAWVMESLLGAHVPQPPPGVEADLKDNAPAALTHSVRERLETHRANPTCAACHQIMDPIGFAMENFDLLGRWRDTDAGGPVNARDRLIDGTAVDGVRDLRMALVTYRDAFATNVSEKLLTYALGRRLEYYDQPAVRRIAHEAARGGYRFNDLVLGVINSAPFQMKSRKVSGEAANTPLQAVSESR